MERSSGDYEEMVILPLTGMILVWLLIVAVLAVSIGTGAAFRDLPLTGVLSCNRLGGAWI